MTLIQGDCLEAIKTLAENSIDALVTDPPAGISFMGKGWDGDKGGRKEWCAWMEGVMRECLRVMKPGAHGLVWALPRTSHWTATALEDAGFEIRDCVYHLFGSGFPKSLDVSKAIDKAAGAKRKVVGKYASPEGTTGTSQGGTFNSGGLTDITVPATDAAKQWQGFGTALKPAVECWWLVRRPCSEKTVAANVLKWGTGALNIDASRIEAADQSVIDAIRKRVTGKKAEGWKNKSRDGVQPNLTPGRFPANLVLSHSPHCTDDQCDIECAVQILDAQSGVLHLRGNKKPTTLGGGMYGHGTFQGVGLSESGHSGASRFFYCAKVSSSERNAGLEGMPRKHQATMSGGDGLGNRGPQSTDPKANHHPTVKPQKLMRYLCRLVTPPNGVILDPFMGSGSTGLAAKSEGFEFVGIEREQEYFEIAQRRMQ